MTSDIPKRTVIIIFASVGAVGLILLDVLLVSSAFSDNKVVAGFADFTRYGALIPLGIAVLVGHWYTPINDGTPLIRSPYNYIILGVIAGIMALVHTVLFIISASTAAPFGEYGNFVAFISVVLGLILGATLWPVHMQH